MVRLTGAVTTRVGLGSLGALICCAIGVLHAVSFAQASFKVTWSNDRLSVQAADAPLTEVIEEVARTSGLVVVGLDKLSGRVTADITSQPREQALETLLAGVNYGLQKRTAPGGGAVTRLVLLVHSMVGGGPPPAVAPLPLSVPVLDALIASEAAAEVEESLGVEEDPDADKDKRDERLEASKLAAEGAFGPKAELSMLLEYLEDSNVEIRLEALTALAQRPMKDAARPISTALGDDSPAVSRAAIDILSRANDADSLQTVGLLLEKHPDVGMRIGALKILARRADPASQVHLRAVLKDPDAMVALAAAQMIEEFQRRAGATQMSPR